MDRQLSTTLRRDPDRSHGTVKNLLCASLSLRSIIWRVFGRGYFSHPRYATEKRINTFLTTKFKLNLFILQIYGITLMPLVLHSLSITYHHFDGHPIMNLQYKLIYLALLGNLVIEEGIEQRMKQGAYPSAFRLPTSDLALFISPLKSTLY